jgi:hypothetical protein
MFVAAPVGQFPGTPGFNPSTFWDVSQAATQAAPVQARFRLPPLGMTLSLLYVAVIWLNAREAIGQLHTTTTAAAAAVINMPAWFSEMSCTAEVDVAGTCRL